MPVYAGLLCDKPAVHMETIKETPLNTTSHLHNFTLNLACFFVKKVDNFTLKFYTYCIYYRVLNMIIGKGEPGI
jgi:hypothetical protein